MDLGVLLNDIHDSRSLDQPNYNFGISISSGGLPFGNTLSFDHGASNSDKPMDSSSKNRIIIEPVLACPEDYLYLASLPKRSKLDLVRSTPPETIVGLLNNNLYGVLIEDQYGVLTNKKQSTVLYQHKPMVFNDDLFQTNNINTNTEKINNNNNNTTQNSTFIPPPPPPNMPQPTLELQSSSPQPPPIPPPFNPQPKQKTSPQPETQSSNPNDQLMASIRKGVKLRKIGTPESRKRKDDDTIKDDDPVAKIVLRRKAIKADSEDEEDAKTKEDPGNIELVEDEWA